MALAFQAGVLNIGGFMACHRFVSHVTGFATFFGLEFNKSDSGHAIGMLVVPLFFLFGSILSGFLIDIRLRLHRKPKYYIVFGIIFFLLLIVFLGGSLGVFGVFGEALNSLRDYAVLILLCLVCGIQNGAITTVSKSVIRTTHLTGITTDLGLGIVRILFRKKIQGDLSDEGRANFMRLGIISSFILGSVFGGFVFSSLGYAGFIFPVLTSGGLFLLMLYFQVLRPRPTS
jgi:uncharacterized membrane protein YoaK (UPF0700 family)